MVSQPFPDDATSPALSADEVKGAQVGSFNQQYNYFGQAPRQVQWPVLVGTLPAAADCYQDRTVTERLDAVVASGDTAVVGQVLSGLGGVGKTQVAADYARRAWDANRVDLVVWVSASRREAILTKYAEAAAKVEPAAAGADVPRAAERFLEWLQCTDRPWLIILDDLADPHDLRELWPPTRPTGRVLVTTRRRDAALRGAGRVLIDVGLFTEAEALTYLTQRLATNGSGSVPPAEAAELAADLGYLPLALAQAAAYIEDRGLDCPTYRQRFADRQRKLGDLLPEPQALPDDHRRTVATTWSMSIELADQLTPTGLARPLLTIASLLDSNGIPEAVLTAPSVLKYLSARSGRRITADDATDALRALHRLSLVDLATATASDTDLGRMVRVHGLVQRATRETLADDSITEAAHAAADALLHCWPTILTQTTVAVLRANTDALHATAETALWTPDGHAVLFRAGNSLGETGLVAAAAAHFDQLHHLAVRHLGPDHPHTMSTRCDLAYWQGEAGNPAGAATAFQELLTDCLRIFGPDHPHTMSTRCDLARCQGEAGNPAGAATAFQELLTDCLRIFGPDHPHTLTTRHHLARCQGHAGNPAGAATALEHLLTDHLRVLGPDHPHTLTTHNNLAYWRKKAGGTSGDRPS